MGILRPDFAAWSSLTSKPIRFKALQKPGESRFWQPACSFAGCLAVIKKEIRRKEMVMAIQKKSLRGSKGSKNTKAAAGRGAKPKSGVRGGKEINLKLPVNHLPAVQ